MKKVKLCVLLLVCLMSVAAQAVIVDDFSDANVSSRYTLSVVNKNSADISAVSFAAPSGDLRVYKGASSNNKAEQVLFLRDDYTLSVGETLLVDVVGTLANWDRDLGIAVGYSETPPSLAPSETGDVRTSYVEVSARGNNQVVSYARNGGIGVLGTNLTSGQEFTGVSYKNPPPTPTEPNVSFTALVDSLYITRLTANTFEVGWIDAGVKHALTNNNNLIMPYVIDNPNAPVPGLAVGFYADLRYPLTTGSPWGLDNLRIIPEPATMALLGLGGLALLRRKRA